MKIYLGRWKWWAWFLGITIGLLLPVTAQAQFTTAQMYALKHFGWGGTGVTISAPFQVTGTVAPTFGSDFVVNGTFTGSATGWTLGGGGGSPDWAYAANQVCHASGGGTAALQPSTALVAKINGYYEAGINFSAVTSGSLTVSFGGNAAINVYTSTGAISWHFIPTTTANLLITPTNDFAGCVDDVTLREVLTIPTDHMMLTGPDSGGNPKNALYIDTYNFSSNTTVGFQAGMFDPDDGSTGYWNTLFGWVAGINLSTGTANACFGADACAELSTGTGNTGVGFRSFRQMVGGSSFNTAVGSGSLYGGFWPKANYNTAVGYNSGVYLAGGFNTCLGALSCYDTALANNLYTSSIGIGYGATPTGSHQFVMGSNDTSNWVSQGYFGSGVTQTSTPNAFTFNGTGGSGTNIGGASLGFAPGVSTGTGRAGDVILYRAPMLQGSGTTANATLWAHVIVSKPATLTSGAAATLFTVTGLGAHKRTGGSLEFCVEAADASNDQEACCRTQWAAIDTTAGAGGETCTNFIDSTCTAALKGGASSGTLSVTSGGATGTDLCNFQITSTTTLTATTHRAWYSITHNGAIGGLSLP